MTDNVTIHEKVDSQPLQRRRGHHRQWWNFNVILLALALFPLVYVRHLWNVGYTEIFSCVLLIFAAWYCVGCIGQLRAADGYNVASVFRLHLPGILLPVVAITFLVIAVFLVAELSGVGNLGLFPFIILLGPSTLPKVIVLAIGFVIVIRKRSQYKNMSRYASIGIGGLLFISLATVLLSSLTFFSFARGTNTIMTIVVLSRVILLPILTVTCWVLVIMALLADRPAE